MRCGGGVRFDAERDRSRRAPAGAPIRALFFLASGERDPGRHLRILAQLAARAEDEAFRQEWVRCHHEQELKEALLRDDRFLSLRVRRGGKTEQLIGRALRDLEMPEGSLVALIRREGRSIVPRGHTVLREGDRLTIIGEPDGLAALAERYRDGGM